MRIILLVLYLLCCSFVFAQDITLSDSVIYIDKKPIAFFRKAISVTAPRYNIEVFNLNHAVLIKASVIKFEAPVHDLKPFYYYELNFSAVADTCSIYTEDEAFPLVMAKFISNYHLISNNQLDNKAVALFKSTYAGVAALKEKIKSVVTYLNETRSFNAQATRDRTKPVIIVDDRIIMQDGVKIGYLNRNPFQVYLANETEVDLQRLGGQTSFFEYSTFEYGQELFKKSVPLNNTGFTGNEIMLKRICYLIENYAL